MKKPKPCPWCGKTPVVCGQNDIWSVDCETKKCPVKPSTTYYGGKGEMTPHSDTKRRAIAAWNRRRKP